MIALIALPEEVPAALERLASVAPGEFHSVAVYGVDATRLPIPMWMDAKRHGCRSSHIRALEDFLCGDDEYLVVMEDDADVSTRAWAEIYSSPSDIVVYEDQHAGRPRTHLYRCTRAGAARLLEEAYSIPHLDYSEVMGRVNFSYASTRVGQL